MNEKAIDLYTKGRVAKTRGDYGEAITLLNEAAEASLNSPLLNSRINNTLASVYLKCGEYENARGAALKSLQVELEHGDCGSKTTHLADYYGMLARALEGLNEYTAAAEALGKAVPIFERHLGDNDSYVQGYKAALKNMVEQSWKG